MRRLLSFSLLVYKFDSWYDENKILEMLDFTALQGFFVTNLLLVQSCFYYFSSAIVSLN